MVGGRASKSERGKVARILMRVDRAPGKTVRIDGVPYTWHPVFGWMHGISGSGDRDA